MASRKALAHTGADLVRMAGEGNTKPLVEVISRAQKGDCSVMRQAKEALDLRPDMKALVGSISKRAELALLNGLASNNPLLKEIVQDQLDDLRRDLAGPNPSALEKLLAERIAYAYLNAQHADLCAAAAQKEQLTYKTLELVERRQERAAKMFQEAVKTLATVRRLAVPALVNLGGQVNIAAPGSAQQVNNASTPSE